MIEPQELRIGNNVNTEIGIAEVIGIYEDVVDVKGVSVIDNSSENKISISTRNFDGCVEYEKIQPIPLTEEMHNKFGVYKNGFNNFEYELPIKNNFSIKIIFSGDYVFLRQSNSHDIHEDDVVSVWNKDLTKRDMYINEFQNLYFALTGEELIFKNIP